MLCSKCRDLVTVLALHWTCPHKRLHGKLCLTRNGVHENELGTFALMPERACKLILLMHAGHEQWRHLWPLVPCASATSDFKSTYQVGSAPWSQDNPGRSGQPTGVTYSEWNLAEACQWHKHTVTLAWCLVVFKISSFRMDALGSRAITVTHLAWRCMVRERRTILSQSIILPLIGSPAATKLPAACSDSSHPRRVTWCDRSNVGTGLHGPDSKSCTTAHALTGVILRLFASL